jgi:hypothetical protein
MKLLLNVWHHAVFAWGFKLYVGLGLTLGLMVVALYPVGAAFFEDQKAWIHWVPLYGGVACFGLMIWAVVSASYPALGKIRKALTVMVVLLLVSGFITSSISWTDRALAYYHISCKTESCQAQDTTSQTSVTPLKSPWPFAKENSSELERLRLSIGIVTTIGVANIMLLLGLFAFKELLKVVQQLRAFNPQGLGVRGVQAINKARYTLRKYDQKLKGSVEDKVLRERLRLKNAKEIENAPVRDAL